MPYCPECNTEYKENVMICSECNVDLLPGLVPSQGRGAVDWYVVQSAPNEVAGYILKSVLEDEGIEVFLRSNERGDILVPTYSVQRALECIKEYFASLDEI